MNYHINVKPALLIDFKKYRIRINKNTISSIGEPDCVLLLINPEKRTLVVTRGNHKDPRAHSFIISSSANKNSFEIYSKSLVKSLYDIYSGWQNMKSYRLYGEITADGEIACFNMSEAVSVNRNE